LALSIVRERYADFGPTFAAEKLAELHGCSVSRETLRGWMIEDGLWIDRRHRLAGDGTVWAELVNRYISQVVTETNCHARFSLWSSRARVEIFILLPVPHLAGDQKLLCSCRNQSLRWVTKYGGPFKPIFELAVASVRHRKSA
jgi:hypothetical protein